jgi:ubiquinone/menaquinone biosynthesis C-methylase UbiE
MTDRASAVAQRYGNVARAYRSFWSPVMVALSADLIQTLPISKDQRLLDLGCGVGTIASNVAPRAGAIVGIDLSEGMLRLAPRTVARVSGDALRLPLADGSLDGAYSTFALQHVPFPGTALREVARVLRPGGFVGTATWSPEHRETSGVYEALSDAFARNNIPDEPPMKTWHGRVDSVAKMRALARRAGLKVQRAWEEETEYRWPRAQFFGWATSLGPFGRRLAAAAPEQRERAIGELEVALASLGDSDFVWKPPVVYMIAVNG